MDKNIIKNHLSKKFLSEESTPGISVTDKAKKESGKINKAGVADVAKDIKAYEKPLKKSDPDTSKMAPNKFNYSDDFEKTYHDEMEILNGQEMIQYDRIPTKEFTEKAIEGIEGSSRMGNKGGKDMGNAEETWNASSDDFGKNLVKRIKGSAEKRGKETPAISLRGKDIQDLPSDKKDNGHKPIAIEENNNNNKPQIKESMKRLKFNKDFNGVGNALKLIPEAYKTDNKEFEMTDGNETYRIRWEGTLSEGRAVVLTAANKTMVNEDIMRMKALFNYKSQDTLGLVKGNARLDENAAFGDIWKKSKVLLGESEDIEDETAATGDLDDAVSQAPEAKKHVEGSVSTEKGTKAPAPKKGEAGSIDKAVGVAKEATKHVEGSVASVKKTEAPAPKTGEWEKINVPQAADAKKHIESGTATHKATDTAKTGEWEKINENIGDDDDNDADDAADADNYLKPDADDDSAGDIEPDADDIKGDIPVDNDNDEDDITVPVVKATEGSASILFSPSTQTWWLKRGNESTKVEDKYLSIASDKSKKGSERANIILGMMQDAVDNPAEEELDEYGDEHPVSTKDAVAGMNPSKMNEAVSPEVIAATEKQFDELNAKLGGKETANKMKWLARAKDNGYRGTFALQKGRNGVFIVYNAKNLMPATGGSSGFGTANENKKK